MREGNQAGLPGKRERLPQAERSAPHRTRIPIPEERAALPALTGNRAGRFAPSLVVPRFFRPDILFGRFFLLSIEKR
jgi:hypothetical protein